MNRIGAILAASLLATASAGCAQSATPGKAASPAPSALTTPETAASATPALVSADSVGLKIVSVGGPEGATRSGILCPLWIDRHNEIVLAFGGLQLSDAQVARLKQQAAAYWPNAGPYGSSALLPDGLRSVPGVVTSGPMPWPPPPSPFGGANYVYGPGCALEFQITNVGRTVVQVPSVGFMLTRAPEPNTQHYDLVDRCSVVPQRPSQCHVQLGGGPVGCSVYNAQVQLHGTALPATFEDAPVAVTPTGTCPTLSIGPAATAVLWISAVSNSALVYSATPVMTVDTVSGRRHVALTELVGTLAFADPSQFSCWRLQGTTFVEALTGASAVPLIGPATDQFANFKGWDSAGVWCV